MVDAAITHFKGLVHNIFVYLCQFNISDEFYETFKKQDLANMF